MAEKLLGTDFAIHGGGSDLVFPHHENEIAQTEAGARASRSPGSGCTTGWSSIADEKMSKSEGNIFQLSEALDRFGRRGRGRLPRLRPLPPAARVLRGGARGGAARGSSGSATSCARPPATATDDAFVVERREAFLDALADDFNTPRAFAALFELVAEANRRELAGARAALGGAARRCSASSRSPGPRTSADAEAERLLAERERGARGSATSSAPTGSATSSPSSAGRSATRPRARASCAVAERAAGSRRVRLRPPRRRRGASAAAGACTGSGRAGRPARRRARPARRARPTTRGSSPRSTPIPTRTPAALLDAPDALVVALDQVQDPRNLGAVCRSAEAAGRRRRRDPRRGARPR